MVWFKVDDNFADHEKVRRIPRGQRAAAIGLWTLAGTWCARHLKDGRLPAHMLDELAAKPSFAEALVRAELWHTNGHGCDECPQVDAGFYLFHDWASCQPTKEKVEAERAEQRERQRKARERRRLARESQGESHSESQRDNDVTSDVSQRPVPDPTRPVPEPSLTQEGGDRPVTLRVVPDADPPTCSKHPDGNPDDEDCHGCRKVREFTEKLRKSILAADAEAAANCEDCHGTHWREDANGKPTIKCKHRRTA